MTKDWKREADVIVVGYGAAGAVTAITAHDAGAKVLILEKAPMGQEGGNSRVSAQGWLSPNSMEKGLAYFNALCGPYTVAQETSLAWAEEMSRNYDWMKSLGGSPTEVVFAGHEGGEYAEFPGADSIHMYCFGGKPGNERTWQLLKSAVAQRRIEVSYATPVKELIQNSNQQQIVGVRAETEGQALNIKAKRAVVLTCGGFENNQEMIREFLTNLPCGYPLGTPYNTGDGITMAMAVGADLWHMANISGPWFGIKLPGIDSAFEVQPLHYAREFPGGLILVNSAGERFVDEKHRDAHGKVQAGRQWLQSQVPCPVFMIFDQTLFRSIPISDRNNIADWNTIHRVYAWSDTNLAELEKGWIKKAETLEELSRQINVNPQALEESISKWNSFCTNGKDLDFNRTKMVTPVKGPPFYALELLPVFINTLGGPRRNGKGQILRPNGEPISRLYSAGELGSIYSFLYQGGGNIGECLAFGRISGRNAAAEKPWE